MYHGKNYHDFQYPHENIQCTVFCCLRALCKTNFYITPKVFYVWILCVIVMIILKLR